MLKALVGEKAPAGGGGREEMRRAQGRRGGTAPVMDGGRA